MTKIVLHTNCFLIIVCADSILKLASALCLKQDHYVKTFSGV